MDVTVALLLLSAGSPLFVAIAIVVRRRLGSPVIFVQQRPGLNGESFALYKFRSMTSDRDAAGQLLPDAVRMTPFGRWLRSTSLDELPELWNVLKGDMSLVGPRPLLIEYLDHYTAEHSRRHEVRPGITGLAQVSGRNELDWEDRLALDVQYVEERSLLLDIRIFLRTLASVVLRRGVNAPGHPTSPRFDERPTDTSGERWDSPDGPPPV